MAIINCNGGDPFVLLGVLFRPVSEFYVRVINELIRRRRVQFLRRRAAGDCPSAFASKGVYRELVFEQAAGYIRYAFRFAVRVPYVYYVGGVLRFTLADGGDVRFVLIFMVLQRARFLVSFFMFYRYIGGKLRAFRCCFFCYLHIIGVKFLHRVACKVPQERSRFSLVKFLWAYSGLRWH